MDKADRDRKRRQKALNRVEKAYYLFTNEAAKALGNEEYIPDLDDLETLAKYFEGAAKNISKLNGKAQKRNYTNEVQGI